MHSAFITSGYITDATLCFLKHYHVTAELDYTKFRGTKAGFYQAIPILDFSFSRRVLKGNKGELKLSGLNVLNRKVGATQFANINYIEQASQNALGNYFMFSFTYNFNKQQSDTK